MSRATTTCKPGGSLLFKFKKADQKRWKGKKSLKLKLVIKDKAGKTLTLLQVKLLLRSLKKGCSAAVALAAC